MHQINVAVPGFLVTSPVLEGVLQDELPSQSAAEVEATSSQLIIKEEEEEEIVEVSYFEDDFEVFNQFEAPKVLAGDFSHLLSVQVNHNQEATDIPEAMGIQCRKSSSLRKLLESQASGNVLGKAAQTKPPTPSSTQSL